MTNTSILPMSTGQEMSMLFDNCIQEIRMQSHEQDQMVFDWFNAAQCRLMGDIEEQILQVKDDPMLLPAWMFDSPKGLSVYTNEHPAALVQYCDMIQAGLVQLLEQRGFNSCIERITEGSVIFYEVVIRFRHSAHTAASHNDSANLDSLLIASRCSFPCTTHNSSQPQHLSFVQDRETDEARPHDSNLSKIERAHVLEHGDEWSQDDSAGQDFQSALEEIPDLEDENQGEEKSPRAELSIMDHAFAIRHLILQRCRAPIFRRLDLLVVAVVIAMIYLARGVKVHLDKILFRLGLFRTQ